MGRITRSIFITILATATGGAAPPAAAAELAKSYAYFSIGGTTLEEIQTELSKRGPHVKSTGLRHPGATQMEFNSRFAYKQAARSCAITAATASVRAKVILPRWRRSSKAEPDVRFIWATLESDIKRHEESHVVIAKNHARLLEKELLRIGRRSTCAEVSERAKAVRERVLAAHDREQQRFDRVELVNFETRLLRQLKNRFERAKAGTPAQ